MKIATITTAYETGETLERCFENWQRVKKEKLFGIDEVYCSAVHGIFEETHKLGFPIKSQDNTIEVLEKSSLDFLKIFEEPVTEIHCWNTCLDYALSKGVDYVILLAADELWSLTDIKNAIDFAQRNRFIGYFKVIFKNFIFDYKHFSLDFIVPRVFPTHLHGGLRRFYCDDLIEFADESKDFQVSTLTIPKNLCFPHHESWCGSPEKLKRKAQFGILRYGLASYIWDEQSQSLKFNPEYYKTMNKAVPKIYHEQ